MLNRLITALLICSFPASARAQTEARLKLPEVATFAHDAPPLSAHPQTKSGGRDSLKNGAIIGAVVLGTYCAFICGQGLDHSNQLPLAVAAAAGMGALIGASIDAGRSQKPGILFCKRW